MGSNNNIVHGNNLTDTQLRTFVDLGVSFGDEEHLPGIDLIMADIAFLEKERKNLVGLVLTHAHEDHLGAVLDLWPRLGVPIYATPFTARLLRSKLEEAGLETRVRVKVVPLGGQLTLGPFEMEFISITHSIPEPNAVAIRTPLGTVVHTGDWKLDPEPQLGEVTDDRALRKLGDEGVLACVCDSTNALVPGESGSEAEVKAALHKLIGSLKGRVAVTAFASNVARLQSVAEAARDFGDAGVIGRDDDIAERAREGQQLRGDLLDGTVELLYENENFSHDRTSS